MNHPLISLAIVPVLSLSASAVTVVNGSFEDISATYVDVAGADQMTGAAAPGWDLAANSPDWLWGEGPAGRYHTPFGDHFAVGGANGPEFTSYREGVSQTISGFTIGETYEISWHQANGIYYDAGLTSYLGVGTVGGWEVAIDFSPIGIFASGNDNSTEVLEHTADWGFSSTTFVATDTTHTIQFIAWTQNTEQDLTFQFLDNVNVTVVPEPSTPLLATFASAALLLRRKRRP